MRGTDDENRLVRPYNRAIEAERKLKAASNALARVADNGDFDPEPLRGALQAIQERLHSLTEDLGAAGSRRPASDLPRRARRAGVQARRDEQVPDSFWMRPAPNGALAAPGRASPSSFPAERFLATLTWLAPACPTYGVSIEWEIQARELVLAHRSERAALDLALTVTAPLTMQELRERSRPRATPGDCGLSDRVIRRGRRRSRTERTFRCPVPAILPCSSRATRLNATPAGCIACW